MIAEKIAPNQYAHRIRIAAQLISAKMTPIINPTNSPWGRSRTAMKMHDTTSNTVRIHPKVAGVELASDSSMGGSYGFIISDERIAVAPA